ncbi:hypothetical protein TNIN_473931 [Trichonephila inaurata madagascariensis]|uniref:Uncharacterized protein n=1 Tax=Trichonephila inaurata madagascariensis TaxID=2747483 RepID=A0A8X6JRR2_9ARAC|nr:hypothetical protein TNIN_473931 [Trichonephila inaurata madagascariensis]
MKGVEKNTSAIKRPILRLRGQSRSDEKLPSIDEQSRAHSLSPPLTENTRGRGGGGRMSAYKCACALITAEGQFVCPPDDYYRSPRGQILGFCQYPAPLPKTNGGRVT